MGKRDFRWRESKKPKKGAKKPTVVVLTPPVAVEVVRKGKQPREGEEAEEKEEEQE